MNWIVILVIATIIVEIAIIWFYQWMQKNMPTQTLWVVMGSKVLKLILAIVAILAVKVFGKEIGIVQFSIGVIICYLVSLVFETIFFLKKKK